jgi:death on curing protein
MHYLTKDELLDLHTYVVTRYGGRMGIASHDRLMAALDAPRQVLFETELYPDLPSKAAALTFLLLKNRPFLGGNEVTAVMALLRLLDLNQVALREEIGEADLHAIVRSVNHSKLDREGLERWLRKNLIQTWVGDD